MKNFLGRGIGFPFSVDAYGALRISEYEQNVSESVGIILGTARGERVMQPNFGCAIHDLVFHPNDANTCAEVSLYVKEALLAWEPRIDDISVRSYPDPDNEATILVSIEYKVIRTNKLVNMVYPFYLRREQDL